MNALETFSMQSIFPGGSTDLQGSKFLVYNTSQDDSPWYQLQAAVKSHATSKFQGDRRQGDRSLLSRSQYEDRTQQQLAALKASCVLKESGSFIHKSMFEYYLSRAILDFVDRPDPNVKVPPGVVRSDQAALKFLQEAAQYDRLLDVIERSKSDSSLAAASALAITALCGCNRSFSEKKFAGIRIPGAFLQNADLAGCDLTEADMTGVQLQQSRLDRSQV